MEAFISLSAVLVAVPDTLAIADNFQRVSLCAELAVADMDPFLLLILVGELHSPNLNHDALVRVKLFVGEV